MVIGLTGPKLAGKGTTAAYLENTHSASVYSMSGVLVDVAKRLHMPNSRANLIAIATGLRSQFGKDVLAQVLKKDIQAAKDDLAVIDGIRMQAEVDIFSTLPDFHLIFIDAPTKMRYERAQNRGEKAGEAEMNFEEFKAEEEAVTEQQIQSLQKKAQSVIKNDGTIDELYEQIQSILSQ